MEYIKLSNSINYTGENKHKGVTTPGYFVKVSLKYVMLVEKSNKATDKFLVAIRCFKSSRNLEKKKRWGFSTKKNEEFNELNFYKNVYTDD